MCLILSSVIHFGQKVRHMGKKSRNVPTPSSDPKPWERQVEEGAKPWKAFQEFRKRRDLATVAERVGVTEKTARNYASLWDWTARADAWDQEQARAEDRAVLAARAADAVSSSAKWRTAEERALDVLLEKIEQAEDMSVRDTLAVADRASHWRRISEGDDTDRTEIQEQLDLSALTTEEVISFRRLLLKAKAGAE